MARKSIPFLFTLPTIETPDVVFGRNYFPAAQQLPVGLPREFRSEFEEFENAEVRGYQFWSTGCSTFHVYTAGDIENAIPVFTICETGVTITGAVVANEIIAPVFSYGELSLTFQQIYDAVTGYTGSGGSTGNGYTGSAGYTGSVGFTGSRGLIGYTGSAGGGGTYTNATPVPTTLGGVTAGTTFSSVPVTEVLDMLLYPYQAPAFTAFAISGQSTTLEVGATISAGSKTFTWTTTNPSNITTNSISILDFTNSTTIASGLSNTGTTSQTISAVTKTTATSHTYRISATNTQTTAFTRDFVVNWRWRMYWGTSVSSSLTETDIEGLSDSSLVSNSTGTFNFGTGGYKYIAYPTAFGLKTTFKDPSTGLDVDMQSAVTVSVTNTNGVTTNYYVHRTTYVLGGSITIVVS